MWKITVVQTNGKKVSKIVNEVQTIVVPKTAVEVTARKLGRAIDIEDDAQTNKERMAKRLVELAERLKREFDGYSLAYYLPLAAVLLYVYMSGRKKINGRALNSLYTKHEVTRMLEEKGLIRRTSRGFIMTNKLYNMISGV